MSEPLKKGDLAILLRGCREPSPNVGKIVTVGNIAIEHPMFGPMREVFAPGLVVESRPNADRGNVPVAWLKKIEPPPTKAPAKEKEKEEA